MKKEAFYHLFLLLLEPLYIYIKNELCMPFSKDFLWGGATAANQCEGGYNLGGRGLANVDVVPHG